MEMMKKALGLGLGMLVLTREKAEEVVQELVKKGKIAENEGSGLIDELVRKGEQQQEEVEEKIAGMVEATVKKLNLATKDDIAGLKAELRALREEK
ncbi:MAG: polyhydroxyalkanoate synthesis regulator [Candidatus Omnitrophica bacterium]|nr:polyhydroxyalkanoate synthesis regulator [Candidatus Omnitrophota bacterium]